MENNISTLRKQKRLTLEEVALAAGTSISTVKRIESGETDPGIKVAYAISAALGCSVYCVFPDPTGDRISAIEEAVMTLASWCIREIGVEGVNQLAEIIKTPATKQK